MVMTGTYHQEYTDLVKLIMKHCTSMINLEETWIKPVFLGV